MKLFNQFIFLSGLASGNSKKDPRSYYCDTTELELPSHAKKWDCTVATGNLVPAGNRCKLECDAGFVPTAYSKRIEQICKPNGWRKPNNVDVQCKRDVNEIEAELQSLKKSLINNHLLQSCTIRGVTNDWFHANDGVVGVKVDVSSLTPTITKIDRINSWFTCPGGCPSANGSNNIKQIPSQPMTFWVFLRRDGSLNPPFSVQSVKNEDFLIHYEVEGPCA